MGKIGVFFCTIWVASDLDPKPKAYETSKHKAASSSDRDFRKSQITWMILIQVQLYLSQLAIKSDFEWGPISPKSMRIPADPGHNQSMEEIVH